MTDHPGVADASSGTKGEPAAVVPKPGWLWLHHDFRTLWVGDTIRQVGSQLSAVTLPVLAIQTFGVREGQLGILTACESAAFLLVGLPAGAWADRWR